MRLALLLVGSLGFLLQAHDLASSAPSNAPNSSHRPAAVRDPHCPGDNKPALMCRLVNDYRTKHGLKPVQLDGAVSRESQYWSDQLSLRSACWFLHHDYNYHE